MIRNSIFAVIVLALLCCKQKQNPTPDDLSAETIINRAIENAGGELFKRSEIEFDFRDMHYKAMRYYGKFQLERYLMHAGRSIKDVLGNSGFTRFQDDERIQVPDSLAALFSASVNSVHYFSVLPYGLNDLAVQKTDLGTVTIKDKTYYKIKVTFSEEGGGEDFDDEFIYWVNTENFNVDYLAYSFKEKDGLGFRFREAFNKRTVNGLQFADYYNYKPDNEAIDLEDLELLFTSEKLQLLSTIALENITVKPL